jgi:nitric oxide reductase NorQ protein
MQIMTPEAGEFTIAEAPFYRPVAGEVDLFGHAHAAQIPLILKGPTGCGKTRFVSYMAHALSRPLITVACHEDLTASDLVGRYLIQGEDTVWIDGPLTTAVRLGGILYLDEVVEARKDAMVVIHPLADHRRTLTIDKLASVLRAPADFMLVISYNPGYQSVLKDLKPSTRQRFVSIDFGYPPPDVEREVVATESGVDADMAKTLVDIGARVRNLTDRGLEEGVSTRLLVYAGRLISHGSDPRAACTAALSRTLTDDADLQMSIEAVVADFIG